MVKTLERDRYALCEKHVIVPFCCSYQVYRYLAGCFGLISCRRYLGQRRTKKSQSSKLLTGEEGIVYGDSGYPGAEKRDDAITRNESGGKINRRPSQMKKLSKSGQYAAKKAEHAKSSVRAKVEHAFGVVKKQLRFRKTRYRGLEKQRAKFNIMFALANLILAGPAWQLESVRSVGKSMG